MLYFHTVFAVWQAALIDRVNFAARRSIFQDSERIGKMQLPLLPPLV
jgi:hypothetical protein